MNEFDKLVARVAALEKRVGSEELIKTEDKKEASARASIASEIAALEKRIAAEVKEEDIEEKKASDEKCDEEKKASDEEKEEEKKTASLVDPDGVEEEITQDYLHEVEDLTHGMELTTGDSVLDVAPTGYVAKMRNASARLDAVADFLEKTGRRAMAMRIDKIADALDSRIAQFTK